MLDYSLDEEHGILHVRPRGPLQEEDFIALKRQTDEYIERKGDLAGLIVEMKRFPGWEDLSAAMAHIRFVKNHHQKIRKVALVTDSAMGAIGERVAGQFVAAEIRRFEAGSLAAAREWILQP